MPGKTLIARQLAQLLNAREPKLISGPELLSMWVGRSEENIRYVIRVGMVSPPSSDRFAFVVV